MAALAEADPEALWDDIQNGRCVIAGFELEPIDVEVKRVEREGFAAMTAEDSDVTLVLDMTVTGELLSMGLAREIIRQSPTEAQGTGPRRGCDHLTQCMVG